MEIKAIGIAGSGAAGTALAEVFLKSGFQVRIYNDFKDSLNVALAKISWALSREGKSELFSNIEGVQELEKFRGADIVIETMSRDMEERKMFFNKLKDVLDPSCVVAANCAVTPLKALLENAELPPEFVLGLNFVRPVRSNKLVELVKTNRTGDAAVEACMKMLAKINKTPVVVKDNPGQIVERLLRPFILSALKVLEEGKGRPHEIDTAFKEVGQLPFGPFETADFIGLDEDYKAAQEIYAALGSPERLMPRASELRLVQYGQLGRKSTIGFYIYEDGKIVGENPILSNTIKYLGLRQTSKEEIFARILGPVIEETRVLASEIMVSEYDIETVVKLAFGWPRGLFVYPREMEHLFRKKKPAEFDKNDIYYGE